MGGSASGLATNSGKINHGYKLGPMLYEGDFGRVQMAVHIRTGKNCAVKVMEKSKKVSKEELGVVAKNEFDIMRRLGKNRHVVEFLESFTEMGNSKIYLVMERCGPCVKQRLQLALKTFDEGFASRTFREMLLAMDYIHNKDVVHRDVKPSSFLLGGEGWQTVKLADFSKAVVLRKGREIHDQAEVLSFYMSPEMRAGTSYTEKTDMFSLGATVYELLCDTDVMPELDVLGKPEDLEWYGGAPSDDAVNFVAALMERSPALRISASKALTYPFIVRFSSKRRHSEPTSPTNRQARPKGGRSSLPAMLSSARRVSI
eukprot:TRINITY_DN60973_c0_g1_i1.p1 TRINITY_DN60973_c0_g1~~TRINITY_DN60973_c0_g1_i1.p1  ORF type:complete len:315 (-),score=48.33 TRINITY_DN60973_c0_g1_i1:204-1148(-)